MWQSIPCPEGVITPNGGGVGVTTTTTVVVGVTTTTTVEVPGSYVSVLLSDGYAVSGYSYVSVLVSGGYAVVGYLYVSVLVSDGIGGYPFVCVLLPELAGAALHRLPARE